MFGLSCYRCEAVTLFALCYRGLEAHTLSTPAITRAKIEGLSNKTPSYEGSYEGDVRVISGL